MLISLRREGERAPVGASAALGHSLQIRPRPLVHKCPLCINTDRKFWALGFVSMCQLQTHAAQQVGDERPAKQPV